MLLLTLRHAARLFTVDGGGSPMDRLEPRHAEILNTVLRPCTGYLFRLRQRMLQVGFTRDQPLYRLVSDAYDAMHALCAHLHYVSCGSGTGRAPKKRP